MFAKPHPRYELDIRSIEVMFDYLSKTAGLQINLMFVGYWRRKA
jgi:hypothetical protein